MRNPKCDICGLLDAWMPGCLDAWMPGCATAWLRGFLANWSLSDTQTGHPVLSPQGSCILAAEVLAAGDILIWSVSGRRPTKNRKMQEQ